MTKLLFEVLVQRMKRYILIGLLNNVFICLKVIFILVGF